MTNISWRVTHDTMGEVRVPADAYYGAQTARAVLNFPISGQRLPRAFIRAQGIVKAAAASANMQVGMLDDRRGQAIIQAAEEVVDGRWDEQFVVDAFQAGAGTSQNMNANEVIANRAIEILGGEIGDYGVVHPNDHVNMAQSTNDTIPVAINIATAEELEHQLLPALTNTIETLRHKAAEFFPIVKGGRTHLQDAVPLRMGQVFEGYAQTLTEAEADLVTAQTALLSIGLGGTAVGTGLNSHPDYSRLAIAEVARRTGLPFRQPASFFAFMQNTSAAIRISGSLRELAVALIKISSDIRLLSSGPDTGIGELVLPAVQPGSSIMPGKVNPVMAENLYMICSQVIGNDACVTTAGLGSQLEINPMMPIIGYNLLMSIRILTNGLRCFTERCLVGIAVNTKRTRELLAKNLSLVTVLNKHIGYEKAAWVAKECHRSGRTIRQVVIDEGILSPQQVDEILDPDNFV